MCLMFLGQSLDSDSNSNSMAYSNTGDAKEICQCRKCNGQQLKNRWEIVMHSYLYPRAQHEDGGSNVLHHAPPVHNGVNHQRVSRAIMSIHQS